MLSRSNFSIRRLMPQRRQNSSDDLFWDNDEKANMRFTDGRGSPSPGLSVQMDKVEGRKRRSSKSWRSKGSTKKIPQPIIVVRSSHDLRRTTHMPLLPDTPHSSKSSLCSCEQHAAAAAGCASPGHLAPGASPVPSPGRDSLRSMMQQQHSERRISPPPGSPLENPRPSPRLPTDIARSKNKLVKSRTSPTKLTFDLLEALEMQPDNEEMATPMPIMAPTPPRRKSTSSLEKLLESLPATVRHPIPKTEEVVKLGSTAIAGERQQSLGSRVPDEQAFAAAPPTRPAPPPPLRTEPSPLRQAGAHRRLSKPALSPLKSPKRSASVSKARRQKSQKSRNGRPARPVPKKQKSKWSVNAKDLLIVRMFNRLEVDEVLSPARLQEIRMSGASQIQSRRSTETLRTLQSDGSDTPVDPFSLQDLPSRIGAAGVRLSIPSPIVEMPTPRTFDFSLAADRRSSSVTPGTNPTAAPEQASSQAEEASTTTATQLDTENETTGPIDDSSLPIPPAKNPLRFAPTSRPAQLPLPSIPEATITTPENFRLSQCPRPPPLTPRLPDAEDEPFIHLPSTAYTLTMPTFRHGPIRLAKADIALLVSKQQLAGTAAATTLLDDTLDWTAFHMAILGGAGDLYGEATDYSRRRRSPDDEIADAEGLCEWFSGFGFAGYGRLDRRGGKRSPGRRSSAPVSPTTGADSAGTGNSSPASSAGSSHASAESAGRHLPIPVEHEVTTGFWNHLKGAREGAGAGVGGTADEDPGSRFDRARSVGLRRWTVEGHPKKYEGHVMRLDSPRRRRRPSVDSVPSLPQSPMLDLVMSVDAVGNEYVVPMGYNLSHDARDFLTWGAENVSAFLAGEEVVGGGRMAEAELEA